MCNSLIFFNSTIVYYYVSMCVVLSTSNMNGKGYNDMIVLIMISWCHNSTLQHSDYLSPIKCTKCIPSSWMIILRRWRSQHIATTIRVQSTTLILASRLSRQAEHKSYIQQEKSPTNFISTSTNRSLAIPPTINSTSY